MEEEDGNEKRDHHDLQPAKQSKKIKRESSKETLLPSRVLKQNKTTLEGADVGPTTPMAILTLSLISICFMFFSPIFS